MIHKILNRLKKYKVSARFLYGIIMPQQLLFLHAFTTTAVFKIGYARMVQ
jgi:hypothetical protein